MENSSKRKMHLGLLFAPSGNHTASWRHPDAQADAHINIAHNLEMARLAERGKLDFIFLADNVAVRETHIESMMRSTQYVANFEPITLLSALAVVTEHIGLVSTASTSYSEPYQVARWFASLDWLSHGRAGWNIVTSAMAAEAQNFGRDPVPHDERYRRAREFTDIVRALWDSWDDDAFVRDKTSGVFFEPDRMHYLDHQGAYYSVRGPLNVPRTPQGHPVLVQAGSSDTGRGFAADYAEVIFSAALSIEEAREYYADVKSRVVAAGRAPDHCKILPGLCFCVGRTQAEAEEQFDMLLSLVHPIAAREMAGFTLGTDLSPYSLDEPVPDLPEPNGSIGTFRTAMKLARDENLTLGQLCRRLAAVRHRFFVTGTPERIADVMEEWFTTGAADGFNLLPAYMPGGLEDFVDLVVPELQRRGLFRTEYEGRTLRENLGLPRPASRYTTVEAS
jgi:FMN-dependent oxidoreductase (nitrilotriacetate monooxygenase family)